MSNIILQICGTSGSGKSTVVRGVMEQSRCTPRYVEGRTKPICYDVRLPGTDVPIVVLGSYESAAGGCDTIKTMEESFSMVEREWRAGRSVVFEGLLTSKNFGRSLVLFRMATRDFHVVSLTTPLEVCYASITARRALKGVVKEGKPKATADDKTAHDNYAHKMRMIDAPVHRVAREEALETALRILRGEPS